MISNERFPIYRALRYRCDHGLAHVGHMALADSTPEDAIMVAQLPSKPNENYVDIVVDHGSEEIYRPCPHFSFTSPENKDPADDRPLIVECPKCELEIRIHILRQPDNKEDQHGSNH